MARGRPETGSKPRSGRASQLVKRAKSEVQKLSEKLKSCFNEKRTERPKRLAQKNLHPRGTKTLDDDIDEKLIKLIQRPAFAADARSQDAVVRRLSTGFVDITPAVAR